MTKPQCWIWHQNLSSTVASVLIYVSNILLYFLVKWLDENDVSGFGLKFFEPPDYYVIRIERYIIGIAPMLQVDS